MQTNFPLNIVTRRLFIMVVYVKYTDENGAARERAVGLDINKGVFRIDDRLSVPELASIISSAAHNSLPWLAHVVEIIWDKKEPPTSEIPFSMIPNLTSLYICKRAGSIGDGAFKYCRSLSKLNVESIKSIGDEAFSGCICIRKFVAPPSLSSIGADAFKNCMMLDTMDLRACEHLSPPTRSVSSSTRLKCLYPPKNTTAEDMAAYERYFT